MVVVVEDLIAEQADLEGRRPGLAAQLAAVEAEQAEMTWEESFAPDRADVVFDAARSHRHSDLEAQRSHLAAAVFKIDHRLRWIGERLAEAAQVAALADRNAWLDSADPQVRRLAERVQSLEALVDRLVLSVTSQGIPLVGD